MTEKPVEASAPVSDRPTLSYGNGEYSCVSCGFGMGEPCEHWKTFLANGISNASVEREASAPDALPDNSARQKLIIGLGEMLKYHDNGGVDCSEWADIIMGLVSAAPPTDAAPKDQTQAAIDEAVRAVDRMTCAYCRSEVPLLTDHRGLFAHRYDNRDFRDCTAQGRAILDAILPILRSGK